MTGPSTLVTSIATLETGQATLVTSPATQETGPSTLVTSPATQETGQATLVTHSINTRPRSSLQRKLRVRCNQCQRNKI